MTFKQQSANSPSPPCPLIIWASTSWSQLRLQGMARQYVVGFFFSFGENSPSVKIFTGSKLIHSSIFLFTPFSLLLLIWPFEIWKIIIHLFNYSLLACAEVIWSGRSNTCLFYSRPSGHTLHRWRKEWNWLSKEISALLWSSFTCLFFWSFQQAQLCRASVSLWCLDVSC